MGKILYLEKRGCNCNTLADIGNHRVCTRTEEIQGKDGKVYFLEFTHGKKFQYRKTHKRTGKPLKHEIKELLKECVLHLGTQYTDNQGLSWRNSKLESEVYGENLDFNQENILKVVNDIAVDNYTSIEFV